MRKWFVLIILLLFIVAPAVEAQDEVGCLQLLEDAREAYSAGMVELVPELLLPCLEEGLAGDPKVEAYKLVINAYLFDYLPDEADSLMRDFLDENPDYQAQTTDPAEFKALLDTHQKRRQEEAAVLAAAELERQRAEADARRQALEDEKQRKKDRRVRPSAMNTDSPRVGFLLGLNTTAGAIAEPYSISVPGGDKGDYSFAPGISLGAKADFPLSGVLEFGLELLYTRGNMNYNANPFDFTSYAYHECQNRMQLPVSLVIYLNPGSKIRTYLRGGIVSDYLISASAYGTRSYDESISNIRDVEVERISITNMRSRLGLYGMAGAGVIFPLNNSFFFAEFRYNAGLFMANKGEMRYSSDDLLWILYHVDSDFRVNQMQLNFGMTWNLN